MHKAVLLLGTNTGELITNLDHAKAEIGIHCGSITKLSSLYRTEPWGFTQQPYFLNQVLCLNTTLTAKNLLDELLRIENKMGRSRKQKWEPRLIDLDILFYDHDIIKEDGLMVPHPHLQERKFTLVPLSEILPDYIHPILNKSMQDLLTEINDDSIVTAFDSAPTLPKN